MAFSKEDFINGQILLIDKPLKWTSFQAVNKIRWLIQKSFQLKKIKVGHAGTLDPLATGLLIICTGKKTKEINNYQAQVKTYTGTITLGGTTPSYDLETNVTTTYPTTHITEELIHKTTSNFIGTVLQKPPIFSAIKKEGKRLYNIARAGQSIEIEPREVHITKFEITKIEALELSFEVTCSKGTYIRSLAHDFGKALNSGAYLSVLRRTQIGEFNVKNAITPIEFETTLIKQS